MITRKWMTLSPYCNKFTGIVAAYERLSAWEVFKNHLKWRDAKAVIPGRRIHSDDEVEEPNKLFQNDPHPRPPGKSRPPMSQKSDSTTTTGSSSSREVVKEMVQEELRQERVKKMILSRLKRNLRT
ncbi:hypothetical protein Tco_0393319 [Tanacetum coccineum]